MFENYKKIRIVGSCEIILWLAAIIILYVISLRNYLLFHSLAELFSIFVAYVVYLIVWKSRTRLENRALMFIGISYFFVASLDLLHTFAYKGMGVFPQYDTNLPTQLWIANPYNPQRKFWTGKRGKETQSFRRIRMLKSEDIQFTLTIDDNGKGFPKDRDFRNSDPLRLELVNILTE